MAITDNLLLRMQAAAGQSAPTNEVGAGETMTATTGSLTLVDVGSDKAWRFAGQAFNTVLTTGHSLDASADNGGCTLAVRMALNTQVAGSFDYYLSMAASSATASGLTFGRTGSVYRGRWGSTSTATSDQAWPSSAFTVVLRLHTSSTSGQDLVDMWEETVSRVGNTPDFSGSGVNASNATINNWNVFAGTSGVFDILDFVFWGRELSDQECADVADDIRGQLPLSGGGGGDTVVSKGMMLLGVG